MIFDQLRGVLAGTPAWVVGGAVRDRLLGRPTSDYDVALDGDARAAAKALRSAAGGAAFPLSERFGAWRVVGPQHGWTVDLLPLKPGGLEEDLAARDFTINAMAEPLAGGEVVDPHGGAGDLEARRVRMVSERSLRDDPLRAVRAVRFALELDFEVEPETLAAARAHAPGLERVSAERIFAELKRIIGSPAPAAGVRLAEEAGVLAVVLPELLLLRGVEQNVFHHLDAYDHTLDVLAQAAELERARTLGGDVHARLAEPFADELTRWGALRWGALLHDIAKPQTRGIRPDGRVTFIGHDEQGAGMAAGILRRLRTSERLVECVVALTRHHLRLGFLVHQRPLDRRALHRYLKLTEPYEVEVTVLTVADRLATRGKDAERAIEAHLALAREVLRAALQERPAPLVRGDDLIRELGMRPGPRLGEVLAQLEEDMFAGDIATRDDALRRARELVSLRDP